MDANYHDDAVRREQLIVRYLSRKLDPGQAEAFETHYLACQDCYEEVRAAELLIEALRRSPVERDRSHGVTVIRFNAPVQLTSTSSELQALADLVRVEGDTRVLIDLSRVSRIDSAGLGMLMSCYTHAVRDCGALKLLHPNSQVRRVLSMTGIDSVVPTFEDETAALESFGRPGGE